MHLRNTIQATARCRIHSTNQQSLLEIASRILSSSNALEKAAEARALCAQWRSGALPLGHATSVPLHVSDFPGRPSRPLLVDVKEMPQHKELGVSLPVYLLQGLAHIEFNALNLYLDTLVRFGHHDLPPEFHSDMIDVAADEARHFEMVCARLAELGSHYGIIPAHKALWEHAINTKGDLAGRIAVVPLVQEARGLDAGPRLVGKLTAEGDKASAALVRLICREEERHVGVGLKWFRWLCARDGTDPVETFHSLVRKYVKSGLPRPFNKTARLAAGMDECWYLPVEMDILRQEAMRPAAAQAVV